MSESIHNEIRTFLIDPSQKGQQARDEALFALSAAKIVAVTLSSFALLSGVLALNLPRLKARDSCFIALLKE